MALFSTAPKKELVVMAMPPGAEDALICAQYKVFVGRGIASHNQGEKNSINHMANCKQVWRVYPPDDTGAQEILYTDNNDDPMSCYVRAKTPYGYSEGW